MCDPVSGGYLIGALLLSTAVQYQGQMQAADAAAEAAQAQGEQINRQAGQELDAATSQAELIRKAGRRQAAEARAAFSASGVSADEGTPIKIADEINRASEYDALNTIITGGRRASTMSDEATNIVRQGQAQRSAGRTQAISSVLATGASLYSGGGWKGGSSALRINS